MFPIAGTRHTFGGPEDENMKRFSWTMGCLGAVILVSCGDDDTGPNVPDPCIDNPITFVTGGTLPSTAVDEDYEATIEVEGGSGEDVRWGTASGDALPAGLYLAPSRGNPALLSGRASTSGTFEFTLEVTDSCGEDPVEQAFTLEVAPDDPPLELTTTSLPNGSTDEPYSVRLEAQGGTGEQDYIFFVSDVNLLPPGLEISEGGVISGQPLVDGTYPFTAFVRDAEGNQAEQALSITIGTETAPFEFVDNTCPIAKALEDYQCDICLRGGRQPYNCEFSLNSEVPPGLMFYQPGSDEVDAPDNCASLVGQPTDPSDPSFRITCNDDSRSVEVISESFFLTIDPPDAPLRITGRLRELDKVGMDPPTFEETGEEFFQFPDLEVNREYHFGIVAVGGSEEDYVWTVIDGELPPGMTLLSGTTTATLTGTPSRIGSFNPVIQLQDSDGETNVIERLEANVVPQIFPLEITTPSLPNGTLGETYTATISAEEGRMPDPTNPNPNVLYGWSVVQGEENLPDGLDLINLGEPGSRDTNIVGVPTSTGTFTFEVKVNDVDNRTDVETYTVDIVVP